MALQDVSAGLMYPMSQNFSADKFALTIEQFEGTVHEIMQKVAILDSVYSFIPLVGTDTISNNVMGEVTLQAVTAGVEPAGKQVEAGKMIVQVKTPVIARVTTPMLATIQTHLDIKGKTPGNFAKRMAKHMDELMFTQIVKSVLYASGTGSGGSGDILPVGTTQTLAVIGDEILSDKLTESIYGLNQAMAEGEVDEMDGLLYMAPAQYFTLLKNHDLINTDFNKPNGSYAHAAVETVSGMKIVMTNRLSQAADTVASPSKVDSTAALYGSAYETSVAEAKAVALWANSDTIMVAESIPMTSDVYWDKRLLTWFLDSYTAIGAAPDRTDTGGGIFKLTA